MAKRGQSPDVRLRTPRFRTRRGTLLCEGLGLRGGAAGAAVCGFVGCGCGLWFVGCCLWGWVGLLARFSGVGCRVWSWGQVEVDESSVVFEGDGVSDEEHE